MIVNKFYIGLLLVSCLWGCANEKQEIKADRTSDFIGKYSGIRAHGDAQFPRFTQDTWDVEVSRLNEEEVSLDIKTQLQKSVDGLPPFIDIGTSNIQNYKLGKVTPTRSIEVRETKEITLLGGKGMADVSITGRLRETGVLVLEVNYYYLNGEGVQRFSVVLNKN